MNLERSTQRLHLPVYTNRYTAILLLAASTIVAATGDAAAQEATAGGSRGVASQNPLVAADPVGPVTVIDRADIELSGTRNVRDLLVRRLGYNSFGLYRPFVLGGGRVAFLVNGRPIANSTVDLDALPISAVERIEFLSDSAAALHGGQAIAGAVNIVLRRGHEGSEAQLSGEHPTERGGDAGQGSAVWGGALGDGHLVIGVDTFRRDEIRNADRDYSRAAWTPGGPFAATSGVSVGGNTIFIPTDDGSVARPLGECQGSAFTGVLSNPYGISGAGCGFAWADIA